MKRRDQRPGELDLPVKTIGGWRRGLLLSSVLLAIAPLVNIYQDLLVHGVFFDLAPLVHAVSLPGSFILQGLGLNSGPMSSATTIPLGSILLDWLLFFGSNLLFWVGGALSIIWAASLQQKNSQIPAAQPSRRFSIKAGIYCASILLALVPAANVLFEILRETYVYHDEHFWVISRVLSLPANLLTGMLAPELLPSLGNIQSSRHFLVSWPMYLGVNIYCWLCCAFFINWLLESRNRRNSGSQR